MSIMVCSRYPKECKFYETVLKRKCIQKFKNNVWENKTKWKLIEKADSYYRDKLLEKYFYLWTVFRSDSRKKHNNVKVADYFYNEKLKYKCVLAFRKNVEENWIIQKLCQRKFVRNLKIMMWHRWKHYTLKRLRVKEIKFLADKIRQDSLISRYMYLLSFRLKERRDHKEMYLKAIEKHQKKLKKKILLMWIIFKNHQTYKKEISNLAVVYAQGKVKGKIFHSWRNFYVQKKKFKDQFSVYKTFHEYWLIKNFIEKWSMAYKKTTEEKEVSKLNVAENAYNEKLLRKCFRAFYAVKEKNKLIEENVKQFYDRYKNIYLCHYIYLWQGRTSEKMYLNRLESKEKTWRECYLIELFVQNLINLYEKRLQERIQMSNVEKYFQAVILQKTFKGWEEVTVQKIYKRTEIEQAFGFYLKKIQKKYFQNWRTFTDVKIRKKMAIIYYKQQLVYKHMHKWKIFQEKRKSFLSMMTTLEENHKLKVLKNAFSFWRSEILSEKKRINQAVLFYKHVIVSKAFFKWKKYFEINMKNKQRFSRNSVIVNSIIIKGVIARWHQMYLVKQNLKKEMEQFREKQDKRLVRLHFNIWREFLGKLKTIREKVESFSEISSAILTEQYLNKLLYLLKIKLSLKNKLKLAAKKEESLLVRKHFRRWISFVKWKKGKINRIILDAKISDNFEEVYPAPGKSTRRQPLIPDYLRVELKLDKDSAKFLKSEETFRVSQPINKKIPVVPGNVMFIPFEK